MTAEQHCPICCVGVLKTMQESRAVKHNNKGGVVESLYSSCSACGSEFAGAEQVRFNKRAMLRFIEKVEQLD